MKKLMDFRLEGRLNCDVSFDFTTVQGQLDFLSNLDNSSERIPSMYGGYLVGKNKKGHSFPTAFVSCEEMSVAGNLPQTFRNRALSFLLQHQFDHLENLINCHIFFCEPISLTLRTVTCKKRKIQQVGQTSDQVEVVNPIGLHAAEERTTYEQFKTAIQV